MLYIRNTYYMTKHNRGFKIRTPQTCTNENWMNHIGGEKNYRQNSGTK
jgi:hypothetical protein